jgi:hypothetical protein
VQSPGSYLSAQGVPTGYAGEEIIREHDLCRSIWTLEIDGNRSSRPSPRSCGRRPTAQRLYPANVAAVERAPLYRVGAVSHWYDKASERSGLCICRNESSLVRLSPGSFTYLVWSSVSWPRAPIGRVFCVFRSLPARLPFTRQHPIRRKSASKTSLRRQGPGNEHDRRYRNKTNK